MENEHPAGLAHRVEDGLFVEWHQGSEVDDLNRDSLVGQLLGGIESRPDHRPIGQEGEVVARPANFSAPDRNAKLGAHRHLFAQIGAKEAVEALRLEKDHRRIVIDGRQ